MAQRGRKVSGTELVLPQLPGSGRPEPPDALDLLERRIWREVIAALPPYWVDGAGQLVLRRLVAQAAIAERREARLRQWRARDEDLGEDAATLTHEHGVSCKTVAYLLTQLRATPQSRAASRDAAPKIEETPKTFRPWDIRARGDDDDDRPVRPDA
jgi:hypothetical protein